MAAACRLLSPVSGRLSAQATSGSDNAMNEKRVAYRRRLLKRALIVISEKAPKIECVVRNSSESGAALLVSTTVGLPGAFDVVLEGTRRRCRSQWRTDTQIGVVFQ